MSLLAGALLFGLTVGSVPLPGTSSVTVPLSPPSACARCHGGFDPNGAAFDTWAGSAMGHAARDPLFLAALVQAERDRPGVGDLCLRCHAPEAWLQGRCSPTDGSALDETDSGITCSACHRMDESPWVRNGQYVIGDDSDLRGPYGGNTAPHHQQYSTWISDSRLCGTCHDLINPLVRRRNLDGSETEYFFPEQTTYSEWRASDFMAEAKSCIDCHMPELAGPVANSTGSREDRSSHALAGGNAFLLDAIAFLEPRLGLSSELARGRARVLAMLESAAKLDVTIPKRVGRGDIVSIEIQVTNLTGHKLPTGYPDGRRVFLALRSTELGLARGHYDEVTGEPVKPIVSYRVEHGQSGQGPGSHLALNDTVYFDNRIPPRGFVPTTTTAPVGKTYPDIGGGRLAHYDQHIVTATVSCDASWATATLDVELWYQSTTQEHLRTLVAGAQGTSHADRLDLVAQSISFAPLKMASATLEITLDQDSSCVPPDAGVHPDSASTDAGSAQTKVDASIPDVGVENTAEKHCGCGTTNGNRSYGDYYMLMVVFFLCRIRFRLSALKRV
jgi:hypothetical protein